MNDARKIKTKIFSGSYSEAHELIQQIDRKSLSSEEWRSLRIAILSQRGEFFEAEDLGNFFLARTSKPSFHGVFAAFFLALGCIRISQYSKGRSWLARAVLWTRSLSRPNSQTANDLSVEISEAWFYAYQGISFLNFFCGNFLKSNYFARKSHLSAKNWGHAYGLVLSLELLAQSNYRLGHCHLALHQFKNARETAHNSGLSKLESAIKISELLLAAQTGRLQAQSIEELQKAKDTLHVDDIYSKNELDLEIAQQFMLGGQISQALRILNDVSATVYKVGHMRQAATLNLRLAMIMYLKGQSDAARALLLSHYSRLDQKVDAQLRLSYLGLLDKINLGISNLVSTRPTEEVTARGLRISLRAKKTICDRSHENSDADTLMIPKRFEDPLGDLIDDAEVFNEEVFLAICNSGYFSLLCRALDLKSGCQVVLIEKASGRGFIIADGDVLPTQSTIKPQMYSLLQLLRQVDFVTRDEVTQLLWKSKYKPDRHEKSLQSAISRLKNFLEPRAQWLETNKFGIRLSPFVEVRFLSFEKEAVPKPLVEDSELSTEPNISFNSRQLMLLTKSELFPEYFSSSDWSRVFEVSLMTATRDINLLCELGRLVVSGKGRATRYKLDKKVLIGVSR